LSNVV